MKNSKRLLILNFAFFILNSSAFAASLDETRAIAIQHNGRIKPFDSFARQTLRFVSGKGSWHGKDPSAFLSELLAEPSKIADLKWIRSDHKELKKEISLSENAHFFSLNDVLPAMEKVEALVKSAKNKRDKDLRPEKVEQKAEELWNKTKMVEALIAGENYRKIPPAGVDKGRISLEVFYNRFRPFEWAAILYFISALAFSLPKKAAWYGFGFWLAAGGFAFHTFGLGARVHILSRPPVSNMYESMIFMSWALTLFSLVFTALKKTKTALTAGSIVGGLVMVYANLLPIDSSLDVVVAVLRSNYWLFVHVLTVVSSYGAFGLALGLGHRHLFLERSGKLTKKAAQDSAELIFRVIQLGTLLIGTGTFLGGVWANESWGRFWGWDPKETWALITFLGYLLVVHLKYAKKISDLWLAVSSILGFLLVLMTWYGVNFVLGRGLHSYGAGTGGMQWVIYFLVFEAAFIAWVFSSRRFHKA
jgi:cytochrome c-type biogenesis protein CcsB